ncbi:hypothetical protein C8R45DRAFT_1035176 [Mycena sanguinolenta]|nr:hypothetical protein C8R45DRAFT_1035176 [Mycena sanguinolenta]
MSLRLPASFLMLCVASILECAGPLRSELLVGRRGATSRPLSRNYSPSKCNIPGSTTSNGRTHPIAPFLFTRPTSSSSTAFCKCNWSSERSDTGKRPGKRCVSRHFNPPQSARARRRKGAAPAWLLRLVRQQRLYRTGVTVNSTHTSTQKLSAPDSPGPPPSFSGFGLQRCLNPERPLS